MFHGSVFGPLRSTLESGGLHTSRTTASELNDDVLLNIFDWYRLYNTTDGDQGWDLERWWYRPIQVCRKWRHLILISPTRLDLHLVCTYGIPVEAMLSHSPPLPLIIYYPAIPGKISIADEESAILALQLRERVRRIHVAAPAVVLSNLFKAMDCELPTLERLSLHLSTESRAGLRLPEQLFSPHLRHLTLSNISLPIQSQLLRQAENLITLRLWNVSASSEFHPAHLVAQIHGMSRLEILMVQFFAPISKRTFESPAQPTPITLPSLKVLTFRGSSTYLEGILARIIAPLLSTLNFEFFNELTFNLSRLLQFVHMTDESRLHSVEILFDINLVSVIVPQPECPGSYPFLFQVKCQSLGWQAACAAQICHVLEPLLAEVESLTLGFHMDGSAPWQDEIDLEMWHGLLQTFVGVKNLRLTGGLVEDLFRSLQLSLKAYHGLLKLLPELRELVLNGVRRSVSDVSYDPSIFRKHFKNIGRAYRDQATTLIEICRLYAEASPQTYRKDDSVQNIFILVDAALSAAGKAKRSWTPEAADAFLCVQDEIMQFGYPPPRRDSPGSLRKKFPDLITAIPDAARKDEKAQAILSKVKSVFKAPLPSGPVKKMNFVIAKSPHERCKDQSIICQEVDHSTTISEIIWRFSRYPEKSGCRLPSRKNPHFYLQLPTFAASYDSKFRKVPLKDFGYLHLGQFDTIYVLQDKSCRLFLNAATPHIPRIFSNLWRTHQKVILKDVTGNLDSEDIVLRNIGESQDFWYRPSKVADPSQRLESGCSRDIDLDVHKSVGDCRAVVELALRSQNVDFMIRDRSLPEPSKDWKQLPCDTLYG